LQHLILLLLAAVGLLAYFKVEVFTIESRGELGAIRYFANFHHVLSHVLASGSSESNYGHVWELSSEDPKLSIVLAEIMSPRRNTGERPRVGIFGKRGKR
jgi:hypothetical protein